MAPCYENRARNFGKFGSLNLTAKRIASCKLMASQTAGSAVTPSTGPHVQTFGTSHDRGHHCCPRVSSLKFTCLSTRQQLAKVDVTTRHLVSQRFNCRPSLQRHLSWHHSRPRTFVRRLRQTLLGSVFLLAEADSCDPTYTDN